MPSVGELTALCEDLLLAPAHGPGVCQTCLTFTDGYSHCYACSTTPPWLNAVLPISYSVAHGQLHHMLASYKRLTGDVARRLQLQLAAILWRFLEVHEPCLARQAGVRAFELVTTVPSSTHQHDHDHPLAHMVGHMCQPTRPRHRSVLVRDEVQTPEHDFDPSKFKAASALDGATVLLVDDTWTTGANAQSAAAALKQAGAASVALVVIGRHLKREWRENDSRLAALWRAFDWESCVCCAPSASLPSAPVCRRR